MRTDEADIPSLYDTRTTDAGRLHRHDGPGANDGLTARPGPIRKRDLIRIERRTADPVLRLPVPDELTSDKLEKPHVPKCNFVSKN